MFFVHWSSDQVSYRHMESIQAFCHQCNSDQKHTFRMYEKRTKHYSAFSLGSEKSVTIICHGCLAENSLNKVEELSLIAKYSAQIMASEAQDIIASGNFDKAIKKYKKILKEFPEYPPALYGISKCLMTIGKTDEAKKYVDALSERYPDYSDVKELKDDLNRQLA